MMRLKTNVVLMVLAATACACGTGTGAARLFRLAAGWRDGEESGSPQVRHRELPDRGGAGGDRRNSARRAWATTMSRSTPIAWPAGTTIEKAAPWVHFGTGNSEIDMQLPTGMHKLTLQLGDDMHRAVAGLCTSITVNVTE